MDHKMVMVENENFKNWLKTLDPITRVKRISYVGRSLYVMGLRGSEIKAALAQLSQRCQVMLVRLTEKEIEHYTRRKPLQKLQHPNTVSSPIQNEGSSSKTASYSLKVDKQFQNGKGNPFPSTYDENKCHEYESPKAPSIFYKRDSKKYDSKRPKSADTPRKRQKKKELIRELFGEDDTEDVASDNWPRTPKVGQENNNKEVNNYLSTTVNVNYYNIISTTPSNCLASSSSNLKRIYHTENSVLKSGNVPQKKLRIDVSLSDKNVSEIKKKQLVNVVELKKSSCSDGTQNSNRKKSSHKHSNRKSSSKKKPKKDRQKSLKYSLPSTNIISSEEDPSIKELWSILGMESPTDRTAKFLSNQLSLSSSENITLHHGGHEEINQSEKSVNVSHLSNNDQLQVDTLQESGSKIPAKPLDNTNCGSTPEIVQPFLKISETFSLANIDANECNNIHDGATNPSEVIAEKIISNGCSDSRKDTESNEVGKKNITCSTPKDVIETISLEENNNEKDEIIGNPKPTSNQENGRIENGKEAESKVGTIRLKSIGLLLDPQLQPTNNENILSTDKVIQSSTDVLQSDELSNENNSSVNTLEQSVEERFFATYAYYFDELVETKIPKLGELLHLALADAMRLTERVKRADQLSSEDLIKEEKLRARKDFIDMMNIRGVEFSPLCDIIIKRFDLGSKITLFLALFCRILKHAGTIDPANEGYILEARKVISFMLKRHQYKDKDILGTLHINDEDFVEQVKTVWEMVAKCVRRNGNSATSTVTSNNSLNSDTCNAPSTIQVSEGRGNANYHTFRISEDAFKRIEHIMLSKTRRSGNLIQGQSKTVTSSNENLNGKENSTLQNTTTNHNSAGNDPKNGIPCETQQQFMLRQTNLTPNRIVHQGKGTPQIYDATHNTGVINSLQTALAKQNVNKINTVSNPKSYIDRNNVSSKVNPQLSVVQNTICPVLRTQLSIPAKSKETPNRRMPSIGQQMRSHTFITPQTPSKSPGIPTQALTSSSPISRASTPVTSLNLLALPTPSKLVGKPPQSSTASLPGNSSSQCYRNLPVLTLASVVSTTNLMNTSAPPQYVSVSSQQSSTVTSALSHPRQSSSALPGRGDLLIGHQQRLDVLNRPEPQQPRLDQFNSAAPVIIHNMVDPANPTILGMDPNQLRVTKINEDNITNKKSELITASGRVIPPTTPTSLTASSSPRALSSPEVTSPTAETNLLPSSSHCHPFIVRRPISGKMKMLFGNNSNN